MGRELKSVNLTMKITPSDKTAIDRAALRAGMSTSSFVRACTLTVLVSQADPHALRQLLRGATALFMGLTAKYPSGRKATLAG
jgi:hypothetical protein